MRARLLTPHLFLSLILPVNTSKWIGREAAQVHGNPPPVTGFKQMLSVKARACSNRCRVEDFGGKMPSFRFLSVVLMAGAVIGFLFLHSSGSSVANAAGATSNDQRFTTTALPALGGNAATVITHRKLKDSCHGIKSSGNSRKLVNIDTSDYPPFNPVPSSKAIKSGPIEHGNPLMPYIPSPTPPDHPKHGSP